MGIMMGRQRLTVNVGSGGRGFGQAYMMAMAREFKRRVGNDADFDEALRKYGMGIQYLEGDEDYFYAEKIYLEYRLNVKSILHSLEMEGFENAERVYNDVRYGDVLKGYPIEEHPVDGDGWVRLLLSDASKGPECPWNLLDGWNWAELLAERPQFAPFCVWEKLNSHDWSYLLLATSAFDERCDFSVFDGVDWTYLVQQRRELAVHLDLELLNDRDRSRIERYLGIDPPRTYRRQC